MDAQDEQAFERFANGAKVLVVTVNYRSARLVINSLSALAGELAENPGLRAVIVDNTCGAEAEEIRSAIRDNHWDGWATLLVAPKNGGYAYGNNLPIRIALRAPEPPEYFWLLNPDAQVYPGATQGLLSFLDQHPQAGIGGSQLHDPDGSIWGYAFRFPSALSELERGARLGVLTSLMQPYVVVKKMGDQPEQVDWLPGASMIVRRGVFESVGLMDEGYFLYHEETDFCLQAHKAGWQCWYLPASRVMHIAGQSTGVTTRDNAPKRRPKYVFDSRHRYFTKNHGWRYAVLADLLWSVGFASWRVRRKLQRRQDADPPHMLWDSIRYGSLLRGPKL